MILSLLMKTFYRSHLHITFLQLILLLLAFAPHPSWASINFSDMHPQKIILSGDKLDFSITYSPSEDYKTVRDARFFVGLFRKRSGWTDQLVSKSTVLEFRSRNNIMGSITVPRDAISGQYSLKAITRHSIPLFNVRISKSKYFQVLGVGKQKGGWGSGSNVVANIKRSDLENISVKLMTSVREKELQKLLVRIVNCKNGSEVKVVDNVLDNFENGNIVISIPNAPPSVFVEVLKGKKCIYRSGHLAVAGEQDGQGDQENRGKLKRTASTKDSSYFAIDRIEYVDYLETVNYSDADNFSSFDGQSSDRGSEDGRSAKARKLKRSSSSTVSDRVQQIVKRIRIVFENKDIDKSDLASLTVATKENRKGRDYNVVPQSELVKYFNNGELLLPSFEERGIFWIGVFLNNYELLRATTIVPNVNRHVKHLRNFWIAENQLDQELIDKYKEYIEEYTTEVLDWMENALKNRYSNVVVPLYNHLRISLFSQEKLVKVTQYLLIMAYMDGNVNIAKDIIFRYSFKSMKIEEIITAVLTQEKWNNKFHSASIQHQNEVAKYLLSLDMPAEEKDKLVRLLILNGFTLKIKEWDAVLDVKELYKGHMEEYLNLAVNEGRVETVKFFLEGLYASNGPKLSEKAGDLLQLVARNAFTKDDSSSDVEGGIPRHLGNAEDRLETVKYLVKICINSDWVVPIKLGFGGAVESDNRLVAEYLLKVLYDNGVSLSSSKLYNNYEFMVKEHNARVAVKNHLKNN